MSKTAQLFQKAAAFHQTGRWGEAEKLYREVIHREETNIDALRLLGVLYLQTGRPDLARTILVKAHEAQPQNAEILIHLGFANRNVGDRNAAVRYYEEALRVKPNDPVALNNLGGVLQEMGRTNEALVRYILATQIKRDYAEPHFNLGNLYREMGKPKEAASYYQTAIKIRPSYIEALINLGITFSDDGKLQEAEESFRRALKLDGNNLNALNNLANTLRKKGNVDEAVSLYEKALSLNPAYVEALINYGAALREQEKPDAARKKLEQAILLKKDAAAAYINLGALALDAGALNEAIERYNMALFLNPDSAEAQWNKSTALLALGRYEEGWALYEAGLGKKNLRGLPLFSTPSWDGAPFPGKRLLIWCEQGYGDALQFVRYAALCKEKGGTVIVLAPKALMRLFKKCPFIDEVVETIMPDQFDLHISMMSLPYIFKTTMATIPSIVPYLYVDETIRKAWANKFSDAEKDFKVGLVWAGNARETMVSAHLIDKRRSLKLESLKPLLETKGVSFYSLQVGAEAAQIEEYGFQDRIKNLTPDIDDFADTAALIENLDLVISVDTSVVHLVGGLGKPVWILSRHDACWRWLQNQETNPWYPTARIFGQPSHGDWGSVIDKVCSTLEKTASERG